MVDVTGKPVTDRRAVAKGRVSFLASTLEAIKAGQVAKGEVLAAARVAGIQAAKQTSGLIPLCHPLPLSHVGVEFSLPQETPSARAAIQITATASTSAQTGVEMEALTAVAVAALTLYDMCKGIDQTIRIEEIFLAEKTGGKSGVRKRAPR